MALRVLYLTDSLSDLDGVGRYTFSLLAALERERPDFELRVLLARKHRPTSASVPARWPVEVALPPDYLFYMSRARFWASVLASSVRVARAARGVDLVHAIKDYPHNLVGLLGARLAGKPCVATAHGTYSVQPLVDPRHARLSRWTYRRLSAFVSVSRYTARRMLDAAGPEVLDPARVRVVPNAVDVAPLLLPRSVGPRPWHGKRYTLAIGELKERKGHHLGLAAFLRVARRFPELHHFVVGNPTPDPYCAALAASVRDAGLGERVHFLGNVSEDEKVDLLQRAAVFLHTPVRAADGGFEGFGIVYLEAAACGVPSIGTLDCGAEDAIDDGATGFLVEPRVEAVEAALARLAGDDALRARLGAAGLERARRCTWSDNARAVLALYDDVLRTRAR
ncbi:MAG: glycosyltransferase family 4 protein [Planctomycetes bacterium]|nr:glycosyltransferase family 4 protein [Planctomycetota bacterium]